MPNKPNEVTTKFNADIKDLKSGIQEAKRQISLANAEFKAASTAMDYMADSADGIQTKLDQLNKIYQAQNTILKSYEKQLELVEKEQGENSAAAIRLRTQIANQQAAVNNTAKAIRDYEGKLEDATKAAEESADAAARQVGAYEKLKDKIASQESALEALKKEYSSVVIAQGKSSDAAEKLANEIDSLSRELKDSKTEMQSAEKAADELDKSLEEVDDSAEKASGGFTVMKAALANLVAEGIHLAIGALKDFASGVIETGRQFETSMSNVAALSGATGEELEKLEKTAREFGATTVFSASESADALGYMALAGWDVEQSVSALGGVLNLAAASGMGLAEASDMVTDYLSAFGLEAKDSARFADMLAFAQANSNTTAAGLGEAFKNSAANMNAAGQDVETVTALLAMMANQGLKGSEAGTALTAVMRDMTNKMKAGAIEIGETTVQVMDANGNYRDMTDILLDVEAATQGMGAAERATALQSTFTADSIKGLNLVLNAGVANAASFEESLRGAEGSAAEMSATMNDNLNGDIKQMQSAFEELQLTIYDSVDGPLRAMTQSITGSLLPALMDLVNGVDGAGAEFGKAIGDLLTTGLNSIIDFLPTFGEIAVQLVSSLVTGILRALPKLAKGIIALANTILIGLSKAIPDIAITIAEVIPEIISAIMEQLPVFIDACITFLSNIVTAIPSVISALQGAVPKIIVALVKGLLAGTDALVEGAVQLLMAITDAIPELAKAMNESTPELIAAIATALITALPSLIKTAGKLIAGLADVLPKLLWAVIVTSTVESVKAFIEGIKQVPDQMAELFGDTLTETGEILSAAWNKVLEFFGGAPEFFGGIWEAVEDSTAVAWDAIVQFFGAAWEGIKGIFGKAAGWFQENVYTPIVEFFAPVIRFYTEAWNIIKELAIGCWIAIKAIWSVVSEWFAETVIAPLERIFSAVWERIKSAATEAWNAILSAATTAWTAIRNIWKAVSGWFSANVIAPVSQFFAGMWDKLKAGASAAWDGIKEVFSKITDWFRDKFTEAWEAVKGVFSTGGKIFDGIKDGIVSAFKTVVNAIIRGINSVIAVPFNTINGILDKIAGVSIAGIKPFEGLITRLTVPVIPELAQGGVLAKGQMGLLEGDGSEAVVPLERNRKWIAATAEELKRALTAQGILAAAGESKQTINNYNFVQNNTSPKSLSRLDIYRQTQNQLNFAKGV